MPTDLIDDYLLDAPRVGENPLLRDAIVQLYPNLQVLFNQKKQDLPLKDNVYIFNGLDVSGNGQSLLFSPLVFLMPIFTQASSFFTFLVILYFFLSGLNFFLFLRSRNYSLALSFFGGATYQLSGPLIAWQAWGTIGGVMAWFPLLLYAAEKYARTRHGGYLVLFSLVNYLALSNGHLQFYVYALCLSVLFLLFRLITIRKKINLKNYLFLGGAILVNISTIWWVVSPFITAITLSHRSHLTDTSALSWQHLLQFVLPNIWGNQLNYHAPLNYVETFVFIGIIPLLLFFSTVVYYRKSDWQRQWFWLVCLLGLLVYNFFPQIIQPLFFLFPFLQSFPPFRSLFLIDAILIILAVDVLKIIITTPKFIRFKFKYYLMVVIVVSLLNQGSVVHGFTPQQSLAPLVNPPSYVRYLQSVASKPLIYSEICPLNLYALYGIRSIFGYDTTYPESYYQLIKNNGKIISHRNILNAKISDQQFLRTLGVQYIVSKRNWDLPLVFSEQDIKVYQLP